MTHEQIMSIYDEQIHLTGEDLRIFSRLDGGPGSGRYALGAMVRGMDREEAAYAAQAR